jgi:4-amino-4-deoxy-L-arabinose transferase-like glycosyltransferase
VNTDPLIPRLDRLARSPLAAVALLALCLTVYLPGLAAIAPVDRDEARFAQASRQMFEAAALPAAEQDPALHDGGLAVPKVAGKPRLNKPPLIYWLQAGSAAIFTGGHPARDAIWMYRLPSALAATLTVLLVWRFGVSIFDASTGLLAAALLAVSPMVLWDAHQARADQVLLAATTSAMFALWMIFSNAEPSARRSMGFALWLWISIAVGMLTKGPITPMVVALTAASLSWVTRDWKWLKRTKPVVGLVIVIAAIGPWVAAVMSHVGAGVFWKTLVDETLGRSAGAKEGHWGPPGYHTVLLAVLLWPGSLLTAVAFVRTFRLAVRWPAHSSDQGGAASSRPARVPEGGGDSPAPESKSPGLIHRIRTLPARFRQRSLGRKAELFIIAWILPSWIVFELVATKLPHYTLPMYPAIALISAKAVLDASRARVDSQTAERIGGGHGLNIWLGIGLAICVAAPIGLAVLGGGVVAVAAAAVAAGGAAFLLLKARADAVEGLMLSAQVKALAAAVVFAVLTLGVILPRASVIWVWPRAAFALPTDRPVAVAGPFEDSAVYITRARIERISRADALGWARRNPGGVIIMERKDTAGELDLNRIDNFAGYDYAAGRFVTLDLVEWQR